MKCNARIVRNIQKDSKTYLDPEEWNNWVIEKNLLQS
jgi:hypothetical protein